MDIPPQKIALESVNDLKNATDDALGPYLTSLSKPYTFRQQHYHTNTRLALGYSAVTIAAVLFYADYKHGWDATKAYTLPACVAYFILNGVLTYWIWAVEAGTVFVGIREGGQKLTLKSSVQKYTPIYKLKIRYEAPSGQKWEDKEVEGRFTEWFNKHGFLQKNEFRSWLAKNVDVVGMSDPASLQAAEKRYEDIINDTVTIASGVDVGSSNTLTPTTKANKVRRKG